MLQELAERVRRAAETRTPLCIRGGGTKDFYGRPAQGEVLDIRGYAGIVAYEPTELVITARSGTPLAELESALAAQGQFFPAESPHFGPGATVGGCVAAGLSGPRRQAAGAVRDFVLGVKLISGRGEVLSFGGQVMKNVAGFDVSRLLAGSLGTLGVIAEVSLKVLPRPVAEVTLRFAMAEDEALRRLNAWGGQPLPLSASAWCDGDLGVRLSGAAAAVEAACAVLGGERVDDARATAFWHGLREQSDAYFRSADLPLWRLSVPSATPPLALPGRQLVEWGGALRWLASDSDAATIRAVAQRVGGHATLFRAPDGLRREAGAFQPLPPALLTLHRRLKAAFDPAGILNPGRMYAEL